MEAGKPNIQSGAASGRTSITRSLPLSAPAWLRSSDEPLRLVVRVLANSPPARIVFFGYVILLHVWVLFVLQNAAMQGAGIDASASSTNQPVPVVASSAGTAGSVSPSASAFLGKNSTS